jgi:Mce-associated membrane protein
MTASTEEVIEISDDETGVDSAPDPIEEVEEQDFTLRRNWRAQVTCLVAVLLVAACALAFWRLREERRHDELGREAVEVAETQVIDMTTVDQDNVDERLSTLIDRTTGDFRRQFEAFAETFADGVTQAGITSGETRLTAGLVSLDEDETDATVLIASTTQVTSKGQRNARPAYFRWQVDLRRVDGGWLVSGMEFVP